MLEGLNWIHHYLSLTHALVLMASSRDTVRLANGGLRGQSTRYRHWMVVVEGCVCVCANTKMSSIKALAH